MDYDDEYMDLEKEKEHLLIKLQKALELELATLPPYLTALFSIKKGTNKESAILIRSIFIEEMLHMTSVGNLISSISGKVKLGKDNIPQYPMTFEFEGKKFKDREFVVDLAPFSSTTINTFFRIQMPSGWDSPLLIVSADHIVIEGYTIGEFYNSIKIDLRELCNKYGETLVFSGDP